MGGNMQPQGHLQTLVRMLDYRQNPQAACDAPRWRFNAGLEMNVEAGMAPATVQGLRDLGHRVEVINDSYQDFGAGQFIWRLGDPASRAMWRPATRAATARRRASDAPQAAGGGQPPASRPPAWRWPRSAPIAFSGKAIIVKLAYRHGVDAVTLIMLPHAVRAAAVRRAGVVGRARQAGADAARLAAVVAGSASAATTWRAFSTSPACSTSARASSG